MYSRLYKKINGSVGKAIHKYNMISDGDRILVGLSGGKDSLILLKILSERLKQLPITYELFPVYIDNGFDNSFSDDLSKFCEDEGFNLKVDFTNYGILVHSEENRKNPCFLCARLRRKRLFEIAHELKCKKVALGHHKDDIIETLFINICYSGRIGTMKPNQIFFDGVFNVIRPLAFADESNIKQLAKEFSFPDFKNPCPSSDKTKRKKIKNLLKNLYEDNENIKGNIFRSMSRIETDYLL